jgi:uncharacterized protein YqeY
MTAANTMKERLRADLRLALRDRRAADTRLLRGLLSALDHAEVPRDASPVGATEVARLMLDSTAVRDVVLTQIAEREQAADEYERLGKPDHAATLREEVALARQYLL